MPPITQGSTLDVDDAVGALVTAFTRAEDELRADLQRVVAAVALDPTSTKRYRDAQIRGILGRVATLRTELEGQAQIFASERLTAIYTDGMRRAERLLAGAGIDVGQGSFTALHREALEVLASDTFDDLAAATGYLEASTKRTIREATKLRTTVGAARGTTVGQDTRALVDTLQRHGVTGFVDRTGRHWRLSTYAEMVTRTKSAHAYNTGTVLRAAETGTDVFEIYDGDRSGHRECLAYNRKTCTGAWALAHPTQHPNCVRGFGPLPLHRGGVDYGDVDGPGAGETVLGEIDRREADAIERLADGTNITAGPDLTGLPIDRPFDVPAGMRAHDATLGPSRALVRGNRLHVVEYDALDGSPFASLDDALEAVAGAVDDAIPAGLGDSIRTIAYTAQRNPDDAASAIRYGMTEFYSAGTSNGPGIVMWNRGRMPWAQGDEWLNVPTIDHEAGHSILWGLNRKAEEAVAARRAAAADGILDEAAEWLRDDLIRLDLDPMTVPFASIEQLGSHGAVRRLAEARRDEVGGTWDDAIRWAERTVDRDIERFTSARQAILNLGREFEGKYSTPGYGFGEAAGLDADRLAAIGKRYDRLVAEMRAGKRDYTRAPDGLLVPEIKSAKTRREVGRTTTSDLTGHHPLALRGRASYAGQDPRPAVTTYAASVDEFVEDWAETWRLWTYQRRHGRVGVTAYGDDVTFEDLWPERARWIRDLFDLVGLVP